MSLVHRIMNSFRVSAGSRQSPLTAYCSQELLGSIGPLDRVSPSVALGEEAQDALTHVVGALKVVGREPSVGASRYSGALKATLCCGFGPRRSAMRRSLAPIEPTIPQGHPEPQGNPERIHDSVYLAVLHRCRRRPRSRAHMSHRQKRRSKFDRFVKICPTRDHRVDGRDRRTGPPSPDELGRSLVGLLRMSALRPPIAAPRDGRTPKSESSPVAL